MAKAVTKRSLSAWRKERGLTVQDLADAIGVTRSMAGDYLVGRKEPGVRRAIRMALALNVTVEEIDWDTEHAPRPTAASLPAMPPGEPGQVTPEQLATARQWLDAGATKAEVAKALGISRPKLYDELSKAISP